MTKLVFVCDDRVYLPELPAYKDYLHRKYPFVQVEELKTSTIFEHTRYNNCDVYWRFMGLDCNRLVVSPKGSFIVHDYNSLSTRPFPKLKNRIKRLVNIRPNQRVFLNEKVGKEFQFSDGVPEKYRGMGVSEFYLNKCKESKRQYDFICIGGFDRGPVVSNFLDKFTKGIMIERGVRILLVGSVPEKLKRRYAGFENIIMKCRVTHNEVATLISQSRFGVNLVPDIYPFNLQPATKVMEYCAVGIPVVTSDYRWIRNFEREKKSNFFKLSDDMSNFDIEELERFPFINADMSQHKWDEVISHSGAFSFLDKFQSSS